ncbi:MAG: hypothetical protein K8R53_06210 [Bacteroidales bacterium]|nr:hypothetical protein [Bacteroidales bacterium]
MKKLILLVFITLSTIHLKAQDEPKFGIKLSGFVKSDFFFDSRQTVSAREGHFLLWPAAEYIDEANTDINKKANFNFLAVQSRLKGTITGPDAFGAKTSGVIEADFFAQTNDNINLLRLRHAFVKLNWKNIEVLAGQYWNPLFVTDCFPGTVSFNTGTPLQSFSRNPQLRLTYRTGSLKLTAAALSQRDYASRGEAGPSSVYLRNSAVPDMHLQMQYGSGNDNTGTAIIVGGGLAYKSIVPRLKSSVGPPNVFYKVNEKVNGFTAIAFSKVTTRQVTIKFETRYGENISDVLAISGFAVKEITNVLTGEQSYTPLKSMTYWGEVHTNGTIQFGVFGGFFKNLGTKEPMSDLGNDVYGLGTDISTLLRVSPRVIINSGKTRIAFELEYTSAAYGNYYDVNYVPDNTTSVANLRALIAVYYFF